MTETVKRDLIDLSPPALPQADAGPETTEPKAELTLSDAEITRITDDVVAAMKTVFDPEIPVDIYELGLIYKVDLEDDHTLKIDMTLTAPGCPVAGEMPVWVRDAAETVDGIDKAIVNLVFDPPWTPDRMTDEARLALNML
ncbi:SUF system Fe-S cluster assembly protein [Hyphobacterium marinum]|uniref:SUF system Fe-S cluster assembly protein n=1 Tax=Hyphobacterium marinum TaxID=3116574 RepID=A0ABU7M1A1_9PROT|nr:SUF system Fe-S cluster assembly protein [Hyphobacterium sp. Y6023]MEE2567597.1 SUF system Fe-S cluster assembly protein [Hyphobacterium sp. Y6023]